jgi:hypothetical protein
MCPVSNPLRRWAVCRNLYRNIPTGVVCNSSRANSDASALVSSLGFPFDEVADLR